MKAIAVFILFIGMFLVIQGYYSKVENIDQVPKVEIRYIPRSLYDEQLSNDPTLMVSQQYKSMFEDINPWPPLASTTINHTFLNPDNKPQQPLQQIQVTSVAVNAADITAATNATAQTAPTAPVVPVAPVAPATPPVSTTVTPSVQPPSNFRK